MLYTATVVDEDGEVWYMQGVPLDRIVCEIQNNVWSAFHVRKYEETGK